MRLIGAVLIGQVLVEPVAVDEGVPEGRLIGPGEAPQRTVVIGHTGPLFEAT